MQGVTGILNIIAKPALIPWAKREALKVVQATLENHIGQTVSDLGWIENIIREAKAKPDKIKEEAAEIGTRVHEYADSLIKGQPKEITPDILLPAQAVQNWWLDTHAKFISGDMPVASVQYGYGGRLDFLAILDGQLLLGDFKTSSGIWPEYFLQVAAYINALNEQYNLDCEKAVIIRFDKYLSVQPDFKFLYKDDIDKAFEGFLAAKKLKEVLA